MTLRELVPPLQLIPVVRINARNAGTMSSHSNGEEAAHHASSGHTSELQKLRHLKPLAQKTGLVPVTSFRTMNELRCLLEMHFKNPDIEIQEITCLDGGFVLRAEEEDIILPQCCGDLSDLYQWRRAAEHEEEEWRDVWIGHPWIHCKALGGKLLLSDYQEEERLLMPSYSVDPYLLGAAVDNAEEELLAFRDRLVPVIAEFFFNYYCREIANHLSGRVE